MSVEESRQKQPYHITPTGSIGHFDVPVPGQRGLDATWREVVDLTRRVIEHQRSRPQPSDDPRPVDYSLFPAEVVYDSAVVDIPGLFDYKPPKLEGLVRFFTEEEHTLPDDVTPLPITDTERFSEILRTVVMVRNDPDYRVGQSDGAEERAVELMEEVIERVQGIPRWQLRLDIARSHASAYVFLLDHLEGNLDCAIRSGLASTKAAIRSLAEEE